LHTKDRHLAGKFLHQRNESHEQPALNLAMAKAYASAHDPRLASSTWQDVIREMMTHGKASTQDRCLRATESRAFNAIRNKPLIATTSEDLLNMMRLGGNSVNHYMRRLHNLALSRLVDVPRTGARRLAESRCQAEERRHPGRAHQDPRR
jgi:hypothetical protein